MKSETVHTIFLKNLHYLTNLVTIITADSRGGSAEPYNEILDSLSDATELKLGGKNSNFAASLDNLIKGK